MATLDHDLPVYAVLVGLRTLYESAQWGDDYDDDRFW